jgi:sigma-B regulation protein RsbU (phosphoserine phosphatase)
MFVTMLYGVLDSTTGEFTYSRAGHELPILVDSGGNPVPQDLERGMILGFVDEPRLSEVSIKLDKGSALLLHTDGVIEAANSNSELFGEERLLQVLHQGRALSAQALCQRIFDGVTEYRGALAQQDDITLVCAHL